MTRVCGHSTGDDQRLRTQYTVQEMTRDWDFHYLTHEIVLQYVQERT
ncbi:unnamed protein product, partial [Staurois parvus]